MPPQQQQFREKEGASSRKPSAFTVDGRVHRIVPGMMQYGLSSRSNMWNTRTTPNVMQSEVTTSRVVTKIIQNRTNRLTRVCVRIFSWVGDMSMTTNLAPTFTTSAAIATTSLLVLTTSRYIDADNSDMTTCAVKI